MSQQKMEVQTPTAAAWRRGYRDAKNGISPKEATQAYLAGFGTGISPLSRKSSEEVEIPEDFR